MRWYTIYITTSMQNSGEKVIRIHDIGDAMDVRIELQLGALRLSDPSILAVVLEYHAYEVARLLSEKLGFAIEGEVDGDHKQIPDRVMHNAFKQ